MKLEVMFRDKYDCYNVTYMDVIINIHISCLCKNLNVGVFSQVV